MYLARLGGEPAGSGFGAGLLEVCCDMFGGMFGATGGAAGMQYGQINGVPGHLLLQQRR